MLNRSDNMDYMDDIYTDDIYTEEKGVIVRVIDSLEEEKTFAEEYFSNYEPEEKKFAEEIISNDYGPFDNPDDYYKNGHKYVVKFDGRNKDELITWYDPDEEFDVGDRVILSFWENGAEVFSKDYEYDDKATTKH